MDQIHAGTARAIFAGIFAGTLALGVRQRFLTDSHGLPEQTI
jgi:hypothetical protein